MMNTTLLYPYFSPQATDEPMDQIFLFSERRTVGEGNPKEQ